MEAVKHFGKIILNLIIAAVIVLLLIFVLPKAIVFFMPFVVGGVIAACAGPIVHFLESRLKIKRKTGSAVTIIVAIALVAFALYAGGRFLVRQAADFVENLPQMWSAIEMELNQVGRRLAVLLGHMPGRVTADWTALASSVQQYIGNMIGNLSSPTVEWVGRFAKNVPGFLVSLVMALLSSYFFVANKDEVQEYYRRFVPNSLKTKWELVLRSMKKAFGGYVIAQLKIEVWMYILLFIGLKIAGVDYASVIALGIAFLDLLPVFGTGTVLIPWGIIKIVGGHYTTAVILLALWGIGQLLRQLIQPKIVGESLGMPALPTLLLLYIGWEISGVWGMILAVPIGLVFVNLYKEGAFHVTRDSILILVRDVNAFRTYSKRDYLFYKEIETERIKTEEKDGKEADKHAGNSL
ncbi:MAG: sporulation integral membrane protein YtvI [Lachnospiraceae bacterium]|nr:sporulation integral membrane protein YtvI [Lachnospiraceae bacterium]